MDYGAEEDEEKPMFLHNNDQEEIEYRRKLKSFGNIRLIGDLFTRNYVSDKIVMTCLEWGVNSEKVVDDNVQQMCFFISKVGEFVF